MVATHTQTIRDKRMSSKPGIGKDVNAWQQNEAFRCAKNLKSRDYTEAGIILDVAQKKVVKNRYGNQNFDELYAYFLDNYTDYIDTWLKKQLAN
jgi:hypothetical protein